MSTVQTILLGAGIVAGVIVVGIIGIAIDQFIQRRKFINLQMRVLLDRNEEDGEREREFWDRLDSESASD